MNIRSLILLLILSLPSTASAQISITEIMYDLEGGDSGREWIEIYNSSSNSINLSDWKFFENDTNHGLTEVQGGSMFSSGSYAVIADNATTFKSDWGSYSGLLFDSSFSLSNTGELLSIRNAEGVDVDSVTYNSDWGAAGDGNSLNANGSSWSPATPTPGGGSSSVVLESEVGDDSEQSTTQSTSNSSGSSSNSDGTSSQRFLTNLDAGSDRVMFVGAGEYFEAEAHDQFNGTLAAITYQWNFGNGKVAEGKRMFHQYDYPGTYVVTVTARAARDRQATDRFTVEVKPLELVISSVTPQYIAVENKTNRDIDLSMWALRSGPERFDFPEGTVILAGSTLTFPNAVTGLHTTKRDVALHYPSKATAHHISWNTPTYAPAQSIAAIAPVVSTEEPELQIPEEQVVLAASPALAAESLERVGGNLYVWLLALLALLSLSVVCLLFIRNRFEPATEADSYTIIDESEKG